MTKTKRLTLSIAMLTSVALLAGLYGVGRLKAASLDKTPTVGRAAGGATAGSAGDVPLTFTKDVAPIVWANCVTCHRPGEVAPFPLTSYKEVKKHVSQIADVTESKYMPPWKPAEGHGDFVGCVS